MELGRRARGFNLIRFNKALGSLGSRSPSDRIVGKLVLVSTGYPEVEEQEGTRIEKVLLVALVAFMLVGGFWFLARIESFFPEPQLQNYNASGNVDASGPAVEDEFGVTTLRRQEGKLEEVANQLSATLGTLEVAQRKAESVYKFRREEYRTAMQAGHATQAQQAAFTASRSAFEKSTAAVIPAKQDSDAAAKQVAAAQKNLQVAAERAQKVFDARDHRRTLTLFGLHFAYAGLCLAASWALWQYGRRRRWRYQTILTAAFTAAVIQLLGLLFRYCWGIFVEQFAILGVAVLGIGICVFAIVAIKRWLFSPERLAEARLASQQCPQCATPFGTGQKFCWRCGNALMEACSSCGADRLRLAPHCGNCGCGRETDVAAIG